MNTDKLRLRRCLIKQVCDSSAPSGSAKNLVKGANNAVDNKRVSGQSQTSKHLVLVLSVFIRGQTCFSAIRLLGGAGGPQGTPCQSATPTAALHADRDRGGPARCGCPGSSVSGRSRRRNRTREQRPAAYARLGIEVSAVGNGENVGAIEPTLQNHQSSEILTCSAVKRS